MTSYQNAKNERKNDKSANKKLQKQVWQNEILKSQNRSMEMHQWIWECSESNNEFLDTLIILYWPLNTKAREVTTLKEAAQSLSLNQEAATDLFHSKT